MNEAKEKIREECRRVIEDCKVRFKLGLDCSIAILTEMGYINLGQANVAPNELYRKLKCVDGVKKVSIQIGGGFDEKKYLSQKQRCSKRQGKLLALFGESRIPQKTR